MTKEEERKEAARKRSKEHYKANKEKKKSYQKLNKEKIAENKKRYWQENKDKLSIQHTEYRKTSKSKKYFKSEEYKIKRKIYLSKPETIEKRNLHLRTKRKTNPLFRLTCDTRSIIGKALRRGGYDKKSKTIEILGCTFEEFKSYIESKLEYWMTWDNRGLYNGTKKFGWDIDHITPLDVAKTEKDIILLNHYTNLQPLCSHMNRDIKKNKKTY
jgi:hypothetical protein